MAAFQRLADVRSASMSAIPNSGRSELLENPDFNGS
jgi:hypothetical protein